MAFWLMLALYVATTALSALLAKRPSAPKPSALGEFEAPTAEEDRAIPIVFGTVLLKGPNVVWYGALSSVKLKKSGGALAFGASTVVGYKYYLWMWQALCHGPIDELVDIQIGDKSIRPKAWNIYKGETIDTINPNLPKTNPGGETKTGFNLDWRMMFGGEFAEGGIVSHIDFYFGGDAQVGNTGLATKLGLSVAPSYNGICHAVLRGNGGKGTYFGTSNYIKNWAWMVRRTPKVIPGGSSYADIDGDANPAEMIYEILTDTKWGLARPESRINVSSFLSASAALFSEGFGLSFTIDTATDCDAFISEICRHIDAVIYTDPLTGLWTLKLIRADYDVETLDEIKDADLLEAPDGGRPSWPETINELKVQYTERQRFEGYGPR
jgi:hypothetical protein